MSVNRLPDDSGNSNHARLFSGRGLSFDGVADRVKVLSAVSLQITAEMTIALWIKPAVTTGGRALISFFNPITPWQGFELGWGVTGSQKLNLYLANTTSSSWHASTTALITTTDLKRLVATFDSSNVKYYIDGVLVATVAKTITPQYVAGDLYIGNDGNNASPGRYYSGEMLDVQIWNAAWTADDVTFDYKNPEKLASERVGTAVTTADLKGWWPMIEGAHTTAYKIYDSSGNGNHGTNVSGGASWLTQKEHVPQMALMGWTKKTMDSASVYLPEGSARDGNDFETVALSNPRSIEMLNLDASGYALITDNSSFDFGTGDFTFAFWLKTDLAALQYVLSRDDAADDKYRVIVDVAGLVKFISGATTIAGVTAINTGIYKLVYISRDAGTVSIYLNDGTADGSGAFAGSVSSAGYNLFIGKAHTADNEFDGPIDDIRAWNRALTATERTQHFNNTKSTYGL